MLKNLLILLLVSFTLFSFTQEFEANFLGSYHTYSFDKGASEISAYDEANQIVYVINADEKVINLIDILDPSNPTKVGELDIKQYGKNVNSIAFLAGSLTAAIEGENVDSPGTLVVWRNGNVIYNGETGALPDMVTISSNYRYTITCNEGEPSNNYNIDPEGSVTIMEYAGPPTFTFETFQVDFKKFNDRKEELINKGIRIFGPNATVAQDLEPEYAVINSDNTYAYVVCQENNCLAVVDLEQRDIVDLLPLGVKDHFLGRPSVKTFNLNEEFENWPALGTPEFDGAQEVLLGGFSGLFSEQDDGTGIITFYAVPDRGPNGEAVTNPNGGPNLRPFYLPDYQARIVKFTYDPASDELTFNPGDQIFLTAKNGETPITGKGNIEGIDEVPVAITSDSYPNMDYEVNDKNYHSLSYDLFGGDLEGIVTDADGNFWMCDEYRPSIYKFASNGQLIERYVTSGISSKGNTPADAGTFGAETLPEVYDKRRANRGFEAIAYDSDQNIIYAFIQSPLYNPDNSTRDNSDVIRILGINPENGQPISEYVYLLEQNKNNGFRASRVDKIGDAVYMGGGKFAVIERDSSEPEDDPTGEGEPAGKKYVFQIDINFATNILDLPISSKMESSGEDDKTLEMMTADDLKEVGIRPVYKTKMLNLPSIGYHPNGKAEGISLGFNPETEQPQMYVISDNDFGLGGAGNYERTQLGVITFDMESYGFDASNRDEAINIIPRRTFGMFMPDGMAMANIDSRDYIITANEGDSREYLYEDEATLDVVASFVGEIRVENKRMNDSPNYFDGMESTLREENNLGRLKVSKSDGDLNDDGAHEYLYSYGARSFAIWDIYGNLIWDSGNDFETITAELIPNGFNATNDENGSDDRSDDKGPEPEGIDVGTYNGRTYAVIGLERVSGFMVYDITNVQAPEFVLFGSNRDYNYEIDPDNLTKEDFEAIGDLGPEGILFVEAENSPTDKPLIITSNEVSGNVSVYEFSPVTSVESGEDEKAFVNFSGNNPFRFSTNLTISLEKPQNVDFEIVDAAGKEIYSGGFKNIKNKVVLIDSTMLPNSGVYFVTFRTEEQTQTVKIILE